MLRRRVLLPLLLALAVLGCDENPVDACSADADHDCCSTDAQCEDFYGSDYPFCLSGSDGEGTCGECKVNDDCADGEYCDTEDDFGVCLTE